jgi:hypothetical protein
MYRTHLAAMMLDTAILIRHIKVEPRMWIDEIYARQLCGFERNGFAEIEGACSMMREGDLGREE